MSDSSVPDSGLPTETPLDRLRRLAKESLAAKSSATQSSATQSTDAVGIRPDAAGTEPAASPEQAASPFEPASPEPTAQAGEPLFEEPSFVEPGFDDAAFAGKSPPEPEPEPEREPAAEPESAAKPEPVAETVPVAEPTPVEPLLEPRAGSEAAPAEAGEISAKRLAPPSRARRRRRSAEQGATLADPEVAQDHAAIATPGDERPGIPRSLKALTAALALLVVLAAVGLIFSIRHEHASADPAKERSAATAAAVRMVTDTTTIDYRHLDDWLTRVQADSTNEGSNSSTGLRSDFASQKDSLAQVTATSKSVSKGGVVKSVYCGGFCATTQVAGDTASSLVYGTAQVTSAAQPASTTKLDRFTVKLIKVKGKWLANNVDDEGVAPTS